MIFSSKGAFGFLLSVAGVVSGQVPPDIAASLSALTW